MNYKVYINKLVIKYFPSGKTVLKYQVCNTATDDSMFNGRVFDTMSDAEAFCFENGIRQADIYPEILVSEKRLNDSGKLIITRSMDHYFIYGEDCTSYLHKCGSLNEAKLWCALSGRDYVSYERFLQVDF